LARNPDGADLALIRLALQVDGRDLAMDEMLSVLAEQCIGLAVHQAGSGGVLIPIEFEPARRHESERLRPDPLRPIQTTNDGGARQAARAS
jgi:hypothetical protein